MFNYPYQTQMPGGITNPYQTPVNPFRQDFMQRQEIIKVNGENGAKAYNMPPNSSILLLDETQPIVWLKMTDGAGYPTITPYSITPYQPEQKPDFSSLEMRIKKLEDMINEQSNNANVKSKSNDSKQSVSND